ncbi:MAG: hypothetical protein LUE16_01615 [Lachnospiraceae bacterium]|nr:hypothetical protein [Lachnospiraceae bacterium]
MSYRMRELLKGLVVLAAILFHIFFAGNPVCAAETSTETKAAAASLDLTQTGSILVTLETGAGETAWDGTLTVYKIADLKLEDGGMTYVLTDEFQGSGVDLPDIIDAEANAELAETLRTWIAEQKICGTEEAIHSDGTAVFEGLALGLYLVDQTTASTGYYAINAFLVSVPSDVDGEWVYDVDAGPKTETLTKIPAQVPAEDLPVEETPAEEPPIEEANEDQPDEEIIHTGQLNWPIPVLLLVGAVCFFFGVRYIRKEGQRDEEKKED